MQPIFQRRECRFVQASSDRRSPDGNSRGGVRVGWAQRAPISCHPRSTLGSTERHQTSRATSHHSKADRAAAARLALHPHDIQVVRAHWWVLVGTHSTPVPGGRLRLAYRTTQTMSCMTQRRNTCARYLLLRIFGS